jgi:hypothetical protein
MPEIYKEKIARLVKEAPFGIDPEIRFQNRPPTMASSEFLTNKQQGDWAEEIVFNAINQNYEDYIAVKYGRYESLAAGDPGFEEFYRSYQNELNEIGKRPDLLIFRKQDISLNNTDRIDKDDSSVSKAIAAIEVRSSSFKTKEYAKFMEERSANAIAECERLRKEIVTGRLSTLLQQKKPKIFQMLESVTTKTFRDLDFRLPPWSSKKELIELYEFLKQLKN